MIIICVKRSWDPHIQQDILSPLTINIVLLKANAIQNSGQFSYTVAIHSNIDGLVKNHKIVQIVSS